LNKGNKFIQMRKLGLLLSLIIWEISLAKDHQEDLPGVIFSIPESIINGLTHYVKKNVLLVIN